MGNNWKRYLPLGAVASAALLAGLAILKFPQRSQKIDAVIPSAIFDLSNANQNNDFEKDAYQRNLGNAVKDSNVENVPANAGALWDTIVSPPSVTEPIAIKDPIGKTLALMQGVEFINLDERITTLHIQNLPGTNIYWQTGTGSRLWQDRMDNSEYDLGVCALVVESNGKQAKITFEKTKLEKVTIETGKGTHVYTFPSISQVHINKTTPGKPVTVDSFVFSIALYPDGSISHVANQAPGFSKIVTDGIRNLRAATEQQQR